MGFSKKQITSAWLLRKGLLLAYLIFFTLLSNCAPQRQGGFNEFNDNNPFGDPGGSFGPGGLPAIGGAVDKADSGSADRKSAVGSGSQGELTEADRDALKSLLSETEEAMPADGQNLISEGLRNELKNLLEQERQGRDVAQQKMLLAGKMLQECVERVASLGPVPGQPLLGDWVGSGQCSPRFSIKGAGPLQRQDKPVYSVSGGTQGRASAKADGTARIQAEPWSGSVKDTPSAGTGVVRHPTFFPATKDRAARPCDSTVSLKTSANPIPENYQEAMRRMGACYRQTLVLISPTMDGLFKNMDPQLSQILQQRMLGIGRSR